MGVPETLQIPPNQQTLYFKNPRPIIQFINIKLQA